MNAGKIIGIVAIVIVILVFIFLLAQNGGEVPIKKAVAPGATPVAQTEGVPQTTTPALPAAIAAADAGIKNAPPKTENKNLPTLSKLYILKCAPCHGRDGRGPVGPSIAGKSVDKNMAILMKYKNNEVKNTMMRGILDHTDVAQLKELATEVSKF
jgi:cytochrome c553